MREFLTPDRIANQIRLQRGYPKNNLIAFLIVEGSTDENVYRWFVNKEKCQIVIAHNKDNAIDLLSLLEQSNFPGILTIVDADFDILEGKQSFSQNVLFTDTHDLETMIIKSQALDKVLSELASQNKMENFVKKCGIDIRSKLIECGVFVGYLRCISLRENLSLNFAELKFNNFMKDPFTVDISRLVNLLRSRSHKSERTGFQPLTNNEIQSKIAQLMSNTLNHDHWHVCCGHDLASILSYWLHTAIGNIVVSEDFLEISLRLAYESSHFKETLLYNSIHKWEQDNIPFVILKEM